MTTLVRPAFVAALARLDLLLHRECLRLRMRYRLSLDELRGLYISDEQVDAMIAAGTRADVPEDAPGPDAGAAPWQRAFAAQEPDAGRTPEEAAIGAIADLTRRAAALRVPALADLSADPLWAQLCAAYRLSSVQQEVLLVTLAPELDPRYQTVYAYLNDDITRRLPTLDLVRRLLGDSDPGSAAAIVPWLLSPTDRLIGEGLVDTVMPPQASHRLHLGLLPSPVLVQFLIGAHAFADSLRWVSALAAEPCLDWAELTPEPDLIAQLSALGPVLGGAHPAPVVVLEGGPHSGRGRVARNLLAVAGLAVLRVDLLALGETGAARGPLLLQLRQSARLGGAGLLLEGLDALMEHGRGPIWLEDALQELLACGRPVTVPAAPESGWRTVVPIGRLIVVPLRQPDVATREQCWRIELARLGLRAAAQDLALIADLFALDRAQIEAAASALVLRARLGGSIDQSVSAAALGEAAKAQSFGDIGRLAQRIETRYRREDLVLPPAVAARIDEIVNAVRHRRLVYGTWGMQRHAGRPAGVTALFGGASGTGKTMSASVIANTLGLDLYRIDLSGVVSKYIGETEKNLERVFRAAAGANCILLFDEADALFGRRSEVKDAHDRYANIEVAYLLQRLEAHDGIVILTTNMASGIDPAFSRRIQFVVEVPRPDLASRERLWAAMLRGAPLAADLDLGFLARHLESTGGEIRNIALDAALLAAAQPDPLIDMALLVRAAARQMRKQGRVPSANEFKHYFHLVKQSGQ